MKILLVAPIFRPHQSVPVKRLGYFYDRLSEYYQTDVLTFGENDDFDATVKTIKKSYFYPFFKAQLKQAKIKKVLGETLSQYDLVIVSVPDFGLLELVDICDSLGVATIVDLRDQPDLDYYEYKTTLRLKKFLYFFYNQWLQSYVYSRMNKANYISVVGASSTSIVQERLKTPNIYNVHNGFFEEDKNFVKNLEHRTQNNIILTIGWVGNIYRFRDTTMLRDILLKLDILAKQRVIKIVHFGSCHEGLQTFISERLEHVEYSQKKEHDRKLFLKELSLCDMFLLSCSDKLIWEPTTSVFDYILFDKPVLFSGLKNNEAYNILCKTGIHIIDSEDVNDSIYEVSKYNYIIKDINLYSRDFSYKNFNKIVLKVQKEIKGY
jgi:hypothetical protein